MKKYAKITDALGGEAIEVKGWLLDATVNAILSEKSGFTFHALNGEFLGAERSFKYEIESIEIGDIYVMNDDGETMCVETSIKPSIRKAFEQECEKRALAQGDSAVWFYEDED